MQFDIQSHDFPLTGALREHVRRRLLLELGWAADHVERVSVRLSDLNGPRGGTDKRCRIQLSARRTSLIVEDIENDMYIAIGRAAGRAGRTLSRLISRQREHRGPVPGNAGHGQYPAESPPPANATRH